MIQQKYEIQVPVELVWRALTEPEMIKQWSGSPADMSAEEGKEFSLWGGSIWGTNTKVIIEKLLEQDWYGGDWAEPSKVVIKLSEKNSETVIELSHTNVPEKEVQNFAEGWNDYYFGPMKELLEEM